MRTKAFLITITLMILLGSMTASAFDGDRKGFMLNLGAGFGQGKISWDGGSSSGMGFGSDLKIGGGTSSQLQFYYSNRVIWYSPDNSSAELVNGMSAAGFTYFYKPQAPSLFILFALGIGVLSDSEASDGEAGFGATIGVGYEIVRSLTVEFTYMNAELSEDYDIDASISNLMLTISWLAY